MASVELPVDSADSWSVRATQILGRIGVVVLFFAIVCLLPLTLLVTYGTYLGKPDANFVFRSLLKLEPPREALLLRVESTEIGDSYRYLISFQVDSGSQRDYREYLNTKLSRTEVENEQALDKLKAWFGSLIPDNIGSWEIGSYLQEEGGGYYVWTFSNAESKRVIFLISPKD